ncbi:hypothetical protein ACTMTI_42550 [Nonomuraea sp. H19]|uniref:hypothetical protein n=1 Tax=Nonomuraea sp. H19 TaxID=3452206 RepID=UPI003F8BFD69
MDDLPSDALIYVIVDKSRTGRRRTAGRRREGGADVAVPQSCEAPFLVKAVVPGLREGGYEQENALRYTSACEPGHGASGSPLIAPDGHSVVGLDKHEQRRREALHGEQPV